MDNTNQKGFVLLKMKKKTINLLFCGGLLLGTIVFSASNAHAEEGQVVLELGKTNEIQRTIPNLILDESIVNQELSLNKNNSLFINFSSKDQKEYLRLINLTKNIKDIPESIAEKLGNLIYPYIFENKINDESGQLKGGLYEEEFNGNLQWYKDISKETVELNNGERKAFYLKNPQETNNTVILVHGFSSAPELMGGWVKSYYDMGYNVLTPELSGHGTSVDSTRSLGWKEKDDVVKWAEKINEMNGKNSKIVLAGDSMGASTVMMSSTAGLPSNVQAIIADCGYTSASAEIKHILNQLPAFLDDKFKQIIFNTIDTELQLKQGINLFDISAINQVEKSEIPLLIIHGDADEAVPTSMAKELFEAAGGEKELVLIEGASHPTSILYDLPKYNESLKTFLNKYMQ